MAGETAGLEVLNKPSSVTDVYLNRAFDYSGVIFGYRPLGEGEFDLRS